MSDISETDLFHKAIKHWWASKKRATPGKKAQGGTRDANLHGKTMDGFAAIIRDFLIGLKVNPEHIFAGGHLTKTPSILPSYFRPSKNWDLVVIANSRFYSAKGDEGEPVLYAAVEFKSQDKRASATIRTTGLKKAWATRWISGQPTSNQASNASSPALGSGTSSSAITIPPLTASR